MFSSTLCICTLCFPNQNVQSVPEVQAEGYLDEKISMNERFLFRFSLREGLPHKSTFFEKNSISRFIHILTTPVMNFKLQ